MDPLSKARKGAENNKKTVGRPFPKGVSGNPGGRPKKKPITTMLEELFEELDSREEIKANAKKTLTSRGMAGVLLLREAAERIEGKVAQEVEMNVSGSVTLEQVFEARKKAGK